MIHWDTKRQPPPQLPVVFAAITGARSREWEMDELWEGDGHSKMSVWVESRKNAVGGLGTNCDGHWGGVGGQD